MSKIVFQKGNGLKKDLENFWWQKKEKPRKPKQTNKKTTPDCIPLPQRFCKEFGFGKTDAAHCETVVLGIW